MDLLAPAHLLRLFRRLPPVSRPADPSLPAEAVAKKNAKNTERRAMVEQMRAEQARKERMRSLAILGTCIVIVVGLLGVAVFKKDAPPPPPGTVEVLPPE